MTETAINAKNNPPGKVLGSWGAASMEVREQGAYAERRTMEAWEQFVTGEAMVPLSV